MVCLGVEPGVAGWKAQTNPQSYGGTPLTTYYNASLVQKANLQYGPAPLYLFRLAQIFIC